MRMHTSGSVIREVEDVKGGKGEGGREEAKRDAIDSERALREEEKGACIFSCTNHERRMDTEEQERVPVFCHTRYLT